MHFLKQTSVYVLAAFIAASAQVAFAEESLPAISLESSTMQQPGPGQFSLDSRPVFDYANPYLNDTLSLQYQNIILEKMILRQTAISRTEKSFIGVGVPFNQPAPPRGICEQIPVNIPCYKAYPDLYPGAVADVGQIEEGALADVPPVVGVIDPPPAPAAPKTPRKKEEPKAETDFSAYRWAEITCAGGSCKAVISERGTRRSVRQGDMIGDGIKIEQITATGVEASKDGKTVPLQAALAPSRGGASSPKYAGFSGSGSSAIAPLSGTPAQKSQQMENLFADTPSETPAPGTIGMIPPTADTTPLSASEKEAAAPEPESDEIADPGPPLGGTGLF